MKEATDFAKGITGFLSEYLPHERNLSKNTISSYRDTFLLFIGFMKERKGVVVNKLTLSDLTRNNVLDFLKWIMDERHCGAATRNYRIAAIHAFARYLQYREIGRMEEWQKILSIKALKTEKKSLNYLTPEGTKLLLKQPDTRTATGRRHLAMLSLMYDTAARVQEVADLTVGSLRITSRPYTARIVGKGNKARIVPLMDNQVEILRSYLEENHLMEPHCMTHPLFPNRKGHKMTRYGIGYILDTYIALARKENPYLIPESFSPHCLRHSRAMDLLQVGVHIVNIRDLLGHASIQTTDLYARADSMAKREALEKAYENMAPKTDREWEKDKGLLDWLKDL